MNHLIPNLKLLRKKSGFTQEGMAVVMGRSVQLVQAWEQGKSEPSIVDLKQLSDWYSVSIDWLVREDLSCVGRDCVFKNYILIQKFLNL